MQRATLLSTSSRLLNTAGLGLALLSACSATGSAIVEASGPQADRGNLGFHTISDADFADLKKSLLFTEDDVRYLRMSRPVLEPNVEELLDVWYSFVGSNPHLLAYFSNPSTGEPNTEYLGKVRKRFRQWVLDTADANFDREWLERQLEIGLRHHRLKKNKTDGVEAAAYIPFHHLVALHYPITATIGPFLARGEHSPEDVAAMHEAWRKADLLTVILWSQPYVTPEDF